MSYTKEEISEIKANLKQIEEYAKEKYAPRLRKDEPVSLEFGEPDPRRLRYSMDKDLSFGVNYAGDVWFRTGGLTLHFNPPEWCADRSIYDSWPYATPLLVRWQQVKQKVEAALTAKEKNPLLHVVDIKPLEYLVKRPVPQRFSHQKCAIQQQFHLLQVI